MLIRGICIIGILVCSFPSSALVHKAVAFSQHNVAIGSCEWLIKLLCLGYGVFLLVWFWVFVWLVFSCADFKDALNNGGTVIPNQLLFLVLLLTCSVTWDTVCLSFFSCRMEKSRLTHAGLVLSKCRAVTQDVQLLSNGHWSILVWICSLQWWITL